MLPAQHAFPCSLAAVRGLAEAVLAAPGDEAACTRLIASLHQLVTEQGQHAEATFGAALSGSELSTIGAALQVWTAAAASRSYA